MNLDYALFEFIHQELANPLLDAALPVYREKTTWVPAYLLLAYFIYRAYGWKRFLYFLALVGVVMSVADQFAASVLKPWVGRLRPCADEALTVAVRDLVGCGGKFSFPSNHATNHFALAQVLAMTYFRNKPPWKWGTYAWAGTICFAQVYVGKHWPGDVLAGALLGMLIAWLGGSGLSVGLGGAGGFKSPVKYPPSSRNRSR